MNIFFFAEERGKEGRGERARECANIPFFPFIIIIIIKHITHIHTENLSPSELIRLEQERVRQVVHTRQRKRGDTLAGGNHRR